MKNKFLSVIFFWLKVVEQIFILFHFIFSYFISWVRRLICLLKLYSSFFSFLKIYFFDYYYKKKWIFIINFLSLDTLNFLDIIFKYKAKNFNFIRIFKRFWLKILRSFYFFDFLFLSFWANFFGNFVQHIFNFKYELSEYGEFAIFFIYPSEEDFGFFVENQKKNKLNRFDFEKEFLSAVDISGEEVIHADFILDVNDEEEGYEVVIWDFFFIFLTINYKLDYKLENSVINFPKFIEWFDIERSIEERMVIKYLQYLIPLVIIFGYFIFCNARFMEIQNNFTISSCVHRKWIIFIKSYLNILL